MIEVRHSLISNYSIEQLLKSYDIGSITRCDFLIKGLNDTYIVSTVTAQFIFRVYRKGWRELDDILYEVDVLNHLSNSGCLVSTPIIRTDGKWISEISAPEGVRYGVLFTFTKGDRPEINQDNCFLIGNTLGKIHHASDSFTTNYKRSFELNVEHLLDEPLSFIKRNIQKIMGDNKTGIFNDIAIRLKNSILNTKLEYGFCHGDFHNFNMHLDGPNIEAFDFDCCSTGYRSYDLAVFWWNLKQNYPNLEKECWDKFLEGYTTERTLGKENLATLSKFVTVRRIWFFGILFKNDDIWGTHWINEKNLGNFLNQVEQDIDMI